MRTTLDAAAERAIRAHGERTYPHECCGLLLGKLDGETRRVAEAFEIGNAREDGARHNRYLIGPDDYRAGDAAARAKGFDVLGFYHSHPDHPARPSEFDREHAWPWYAYLIVAVEKGRSKALNAFRLADDRSRMDDEPLEITDTRERGSSPAPPHLREQPES